VNIPKNVAAQKERSINKHTQSFAKSVGEMYYKTKNQIRNKEINRERKGT
jgi:hypothetical protein